MLISTNWEDVTAQDLDLSAFGGLPSSVTIYRTTADDATNLARKHYAFIGVPHH